MLQGWLPNAQPLGLQKQRPLEPQAELLLLQVAGKAGRAGVSSRLTRCGAVQEAGQAAASMRG